MAERSRLLGEDLEAFRRGDSPTKTENGERTAAKRFRAIERDQMVIRPVDVEKLVEADHKVRAIWGRLSIKLCLRGLIESPQSEIETSR
jgi:hypothetical protein